MTTYCPIVIDTETTGAVRAYVPGLRLRADRQGGGRVKPSGAHDRVFGGLVWTSEPVNPRV